MLLYPEEQNMNKADILISGATGRTGGAAIDTLLEMGKRIRAYVRSDDERAAALRQRGVDVAVGDFTEIDHIRAAMEGISSAYFLHPIAPGIIGAAAYFAQAAKEAGVTAIVNMSQISAEWLIYPHFAKEIWAKKKIEFPFENGRHAPISADDQGRVIAHILARPAGHEGKIYTLHGPVELNYTEIAAAMSEVLGAKIEYVPTSIEVFKQKMEQLYEFPPFLAQHLVEVAQNYREGIFAGTNDVVEKISGTPALSISAYIEKHRKAFA
jgi:NAD(P)H dehydrogenase (quinone)